MQPTLRLTSTDDLAQAGAKKSLRESSPSERQAVAARLTRFLNKRPKYLGDRPIRLLDFSPIDLPIAELLASTNDEIRVTRLAESAVAGELLRDRDPGAEILECTLDRLQSDGPDGFDVVHTALMLGSRRELPLMTGLTQLGRLGMHGFLWTDRVKQTQPMKASRVRDLARRVDLEFCAYKKPIRSTLFSLSGWRPQL